MMFLLLAGLNCGLTSLITYAVYVLDKSAARRGRRRVPERTLHLLALLGGWPGALLAQRQLRHKTAKPRFLWASRLAALLNCALLAVLARTLLS